MKSSPPPPPVVDRRQARQESTSGRTVRIYARDNAVVQYQPAMRESGLSAVAKFFDPHQESRRLATELAATLDELGEAPARLMAFIEEQADSIRQEPLLSADRRCVLTRYHYGMVAWGILANRIPPDSDLGPATYDLRRELEHALREHRQRADRRVQGLVVSVFSIWVLAMVLPLFAVVVLSLLPLPGRVTAPQPQSGATRQGMEAPASPASLKSPSTDVGVCVEPGGANRELGGGSAQSGSVVVRPLAGRRPFPEPDECHRWRT